MKKIEAKSLEEAYEKAAKEFDCSVTDLKYEIVQHPSSGFLGFGAKKAIIVATCERQKPDEPVEHQTKVASHVQEKPVETADKTEISQEEDQKNTEGVGETVDSIEDAILDDFFNDTSGKASISDAKKANLEATETVVRNESELSLEIEERLKSLIESACFDVDTVEVDVIDGTAYIFMDGEDAALLIGKEGYRYNALSYLLYNWIHNEYGLFIKLEIAQFLASQQEMISNYIQPVIDHVYKEGWGKTRPLDGILVQIALEQLREEFPHKYVAIKRTKTGDRYILINEFNKKQ